MSLDLREELPALRLQGLIENVERVVLGQTEAVTLCVVGLLAEGHVLLEDVPGTGKTTLAKALARSVDVEFRRVQFTSDLLPADLLGVSVWSAAQERFVFRPGPIFGGIVLADELNRTAPRTQSALLECMNERRASVDGETHSLPRPFLVIATQNPLEFEGTYPLPESQLDRFLLRVRMGYPPREAEREVLKSRLLRDPLDELEPVMSREELERAIEAVRRVRVHEELFEYVLAFLEATRTEARLLLGASPRAGLGWLQAARALALLDGRDHCVPDDFKRACLPVLAHRVVTAAPIASGLAHAFAGAAGARSNAASEAETVLLELQRRVPIPA